jgi:Xaa-Pro aminopeptidase
VAPPFPHAEHKRRLALVQGEMARLDVDLLLVDGVEAMLWLTGFGVSQTMWRCCAVPRSGLPFLFVRALDAAPARERTCFPDVASFLDWEDEVAALAAAVRERSWPVQSWALDFDSHSTTLRRFERLRRAFAPAEVRDFGEALPDLRLPKSSEEAGCLRAAAAVAEGAMARAVAAVRLGGTERDCYAAAAQAFIELGADDGWVGPVTAGRGWNFLHGHLHGEPLAEGDIVHVEVIPKVRSYTARLMRSVVVGEPSARQREVMAALLRLQDRQIAAMSPGAEAAVVDAVLREGVLAEGLRTDFPNITGYTLGIYAAHSQRASDFTRTFSPASRWRLEPGTAFHMYVSAQGLAVSESVLVTDEGPELLTRFPRRLFTTAEAGAAAKQAGEA